MHGRNAERGAKAVQRDRKLPAARHVSSPPTCRTPTTCRGSPPRRATSDILVNNAGIYGSPPTFDTDDADFDAMFDTNLRAPYILVQKLVPGMIERGHGTVINISTVAASTPSQDAGIYGASKAALELLTKLWADEFGAPGVRVNAVAPGPDQTQGTADMSPDWSRTRPHHGARARGGADEIANAVTFIASPAASYINGVVLTVDGGARRPLRAWSL